MTIKCGGPVLIVGTLFVSLGAHPLLAAPHNTIPPGVEMAGIYRGDLVARGASGPLVTLAKGGGARALPVWSPDGSSIAFVQATDPRRALADLVVVGSDGGEISRVQIEPVVSDTEYTGMRSIEGLTWIAPNRLAVWGSINPSQSQYYVIDVHDKRIVNDFIDDESAAAFSPDGTHVATLSGKPHFGSAQHAVPTVMVDGHPTGDGGVVGSAIEKPPQWSPDGQTLAWIMRAPSGSESLLQWRGGTTSSTMLPDTDNSDVDFRWSGNTILVTVSQSGTTNPALVLAVSPNGKSARVVNAKEAVDPLTAARVLRQQLVAAMGLDGVVEPDFWCPSCSLRMLPRSND